MPDLSALPGFLASASQAFCGYQPGAAWIALLGLLVLAVSCLLCALCFCTGCACGLGLGWLISHQEAPALARAAARGVSRVAAAPQLTGPLSRLSGYLEERPHGA